MTRWGRPATVALVALALAAFLFLFVFPTRSYLSQRHDVAKAQHAVDVLRKQNDALAREADRLRAPAEIERMARDQYHMALPGEQVYNVVPAPDPAAASTTTTAP